MYPHHYVLLAINYTHNKALCTLFVSLVSLMHIIKKSVAYLSKVMDHFTHARSQSTRSSSDTIQVGIFNAMYHFYVVDTPSDAYIYKTLFHW